MKYIRNIYILIILVFTTLGSLEAQNYKYYVRAISHNFDPTFIVDEGVLNYTGTDTDLDSIFEMNNIYVFEKAFTHSKRSNLMRTFYVESDSSNLLNEFLTNTAHIFDFGEEQGQDEIVLSYYPNDYGETAIPVQSSGINISNFDFIDAPSAWDITTGDTSVKIGISDGAVLDDFDFNGKLVRLPSASITYGPEHGITVSAIAAAQGDNGHGSVGVCYDCSLIAARHNYDAILELSYAGSQIINCSWEDYSFSISEQGCIDEAYDNGSIIVAASGNRSSNSSFPVNYPASYNHVISIGSVGQKHATPTEYLVLGGVRYYSSNIMHLVAGGIIFDIGEDPTTNPDATYQLMPSPFNTNSMNPFVDLMAPGVGIFQYGYLALHGDIVYNGIHTSPAAPHVSGTLGLMLTLNSCLPFEEAESILKIGSINIDHVSGNAFAYGNYGSGSLNTGNSVELTRALLDLTATAYIENQDFSRWDFIVKGISENILIQNQIFRDDATLHVIAKNAITINEETLMKPNTNGYELLEIDDLLTIETVCSMNTTPPRLADNPKDRNEKNKESFSVYPNPTTGILNIKSLVNIEEVTIIDYTGKIILQINAVNNNTLSVDMSKYSLGMYFVKAKLVSGVTLTRKIIKG